MKKTIQSIIGFSALLILAASIASCKINDVTTEDKGPPAVVYDAESKSATISFHSYDDMKYANVIRLKCGDKKFSGSVSKENIGQIVPSNINKLSETYQFKDSNLEADAELTVASALSAGLDSTVKVSSDGIAGGVNGETDEEYLTRVMTALRNTTRYGKTGDFAAWAMDSTSEVTKAFEIPSFDIFGSLLIQVIHGKQIDGVEQVHNIQAVQSYIEQYSPKIIFTVRTPELVPISPAIHLSEGEDTVSNRNLVLQRLKVYLNAKAEPGCTITQATLQTVITDGVTISKAELTLPGGEVKATVLQYPVLGDVTWL